MHYLKVIIGLIVSICALLFYCDVFSNTNKGRTMDYSKQLHKLLQTKAQNIETPYSFKIHKENNYYEVIIKSQNTEKIKKIPESYVSKLFEHQDKDVEKNILDIIFIPGKK